MSTVEGCVDRISTTEISGWVWDRASPQSRLEVRIEVDGVIAARVSANRLRPDLKAIGKGDGQYGFLAIFERPIEISRTNVQCLAGAENYSLLAAGDAFAGQKIAAPAKLIEHRGAKTRVGLIAPSPRVSDAFMHSAEHLFAHSGQNTGNFAFTHALFEHLRPNVTLLHWHERPEVVREKCDVLLIACANQLGPHSDMTVWADALEKFQLPAVGIGLGAQAPEMTGYVTLTQGTRRWLDVMASLSPSSHPNLGLRGDFTLSQLEHFGLGDRGAVMGCPSNFINYDSMLYDTLRMKYSAARAERIGVAAGLRHFGHIVEIERNLARLVTATKGSYIAQSELNMIRLARNEFDSIDTAELRLIRDYISPGSTLDEFELWCKRHATCFIDAPSWLEAMRNYDFVAGARFHGVMLAIQAGTPGGVVAHDSRTAELCQTTCIPYKDYRELPDEFDENDLAHLFPFDESGYRASRQRLLAQYAGILTAAGIQPNREFMKLCADMPAHIEAR